MKVEGTGRRWLIASILLAFIATRVFAGYVADHPDFYGPNRPDGTGDVHLFDYFTWEMRHDHYSPYGETLRMDVYRPRLARFLNSLVHLRRSISRKI